MQVVAYPSNKFTKEFDELEIGSIFIYEEKLWVKIACYISGKKGKAMCFDTHDNEKIPKDSQVCEVEKDDIKIEVWGKIYKSYLNSSRVIHDPTEEDG